MQKIDKERRKFAKALAAGAAFGVPFMASFSMDGLEFSAAEAGHRSGNEEKEKAPKRKAAKKTATKKKAAKKKAAKK